MYCTYFPWKYKTFALFPRIENIAECKIIIYDEDILKIILSKGHVFRSVFIIISTGYSRGEDVFPFHCRFICRFNCSAAVRSNFTSGLSETKTISGSCRGWFARNRYFPRQRQLVTLVRFGRDDAAHGQLSEGLQQQVGPVGGRGRRRGRGWSVGPEPMTGGARTCVRRDAARRVASRRVARRRGDSAWHDHEKFRRSRSTFARRSKNLSLPPPFPLSRRRRRTGSATECPRVLCRVASSPIAVSPDRLPEHLWPRKSFPSADFREATRPAKWSRDSSRNRSHLPSSKLFGGDSFRKSRDATKVSKL